MSKGTKTMKAILRNPLLRLLLIALIATSSLVLIARIGSLFMGKNPVVLLITADSLRPDHLSCYGYGPISTKSLDELAEDGVLFENAYCSVPARIYSYAAVLTGKNGGTATVAKGGTVRLNDLCRSLSEYLRNEGYLTIAVTSDPVLAKDAGFGRGFDIVENVPPGAPETRDDQTDAEKNLTQTALELLWKNKRKPVFMWLEYPIPLFPYQVPENFRKARDQHLYDRQIVLLDGKISMLLRGMRELGLDKAATIVFTAANGESLNEHKEFTRGIFVYDSTARVPLIIKSPKCPPGKRVKTIASHIDIAPTILDELGINYDPRNFDGESLVPVIADEKDAEPRSLYIESPIGYHAFGWSPVVGLISDDHKYIELPKPELYDLKKDPHELHNIVNENAAKAGAMREELLGYIAEKRPQLAGIIDKGTDPKDKVQLIRPYMLSASDPRSVIKFFRERLTADPKNKMFKFQLARAYFTAGNFYESEYLLLSLTLTYPGYNQAWELLGLVYEKQEDIDSAMECYEKAVSISPDMLTSLNNLAWRYAEQGVDLDKALEYSERANKLAPDNVSFLDTLAEVYFKTGDKTRAEELLEQAVSMAVETKSKKLRYLRKRLKEIQDS